MARSPSRSHTRPRRARTGSACRHVPGRTAARPRPPGTTRRPAARPDPPRQADAGTPPTPLTAAPRPGPGCYPRTPPASTRRHPARQPGTSAWTTNIRRPGGAPADHPGEPAGQRERPVLSDRMSTAAGSRCRRMSSPRRRRAHLRDRRRWGRVELPTFRFSGEI